MVDVEKLAAQPRRSVVLASLLPGDARARCSLGSVLTASGVPRSTRVDNSL